MDQYDRITDILQKQSPAFNEQNLSRSFAISPDMTQSFIQQHNQIQQQPAQQAMDILKVFESKKASGDAKAKALDDKISMFTGGDPEGHVLFLQALHEDPEEIDPTNSYQVMTKLASIAKRTGYKSPELDLDRRKREAEIKKLENTGTKAPSGYRFDEAGALEAIPGGPADQKFQLKKANDQNLINNAVRKLDEQINLVNSVSSAPGTDSNFGLSSMIPNRPGSEASDAEALLKRLDASTFISALQEIKSQSQTGASGLGALSEREGDKVQNAAAALARSQSDESFRVNLENYRKALEETKEDMVRGYQNIYGEKGSESRSQQQSGVAPEGTIITNAQGQKMQKVNGKWEPM